MNGEPRSANESRAVILAPTGRDAELAEDALRPGGIAPLVCPDMDGLCREIAAGVGAVLVAEEALASGGHECLLEIVTRQPPWSDLPVLVLTLRGSDSETVRRALDELGNVTLLERPVRIAALVSAVRVALRARERQYELRSRLEAQALLASIVSSSDDAIVSETLQGRILTWNVGAERIFGYSAEEAIGQAITLIVPPDRLDEERGILARLVAGERIEHYETTRLRKNGERVDISLTISPIRDAADRIIGASKVARDITAQKRAEEALRDADRRKDEFLAMLAHELRNPLAPVRNSLQILRLASQTDPEIERVRELMDRQVNHMVRLVDDLVEVSRITRGKIELRRQPVELATVLRAAIETSQPQIDAAGHRLVVDLPPESIVLDGDPVRLAQVFSNLLNNAAKYAEDRGEIRVTARREGADAVVSIRDHGVGIPAEMLTRIFDMFTQVNGPDHGSHGGLGIGLTLVRSLVEMHGGSVAARSDGVGHGSEFVIRLPGTDAAPPPRERPRARRGTFPGVRALVVDDNRDAADSLGMLLECVGATVRVFHDGPSALDALPEFRPGLILLDIGMPGMDGYELARRIRERPELHDVVLVALTGWSQDEYRRRSVAAGFDQHLIKPTDIDSLRALIESVARRPRSEDLGAPGGDVGGEQPVRS